MFGNSNKRDTSPNIPPAPPQQQSGGGKRGMFSVLGPDVVVKGDVTASADLHIDGRIEGDVHCSSLAQGAESQIFGNVTAESARLAGSIEGGVRVKQLTVERSARITGDVEYENITIENGGNIDGRLKHMSRVETAPVQRPSAEAARPREAGAQPGPSPFQAGSKTEAA